MNQLMSGWCLIFLFKQIKEIIVGKQKIREIRKKMLQETVVITFRRDECTTEVHQRQWSQLYCYPTEH